MNPAGMIEIPVRVQAESDDLRDDVDEVTLDDVVRVRSWGWDMGPAVVICERSMAVSRPVVSRVDLTCACLSRGRRRCRGPSLSGPAGTGSREVHEEGTAWDWFSPEELPADLLPCARVWLADAAAGRSRVMLR